MRGAPDWRLTDAAGEARLDPSGVTVVHGDGWTGRYERVSFGAGFHMHLGELDVARDCEHGVQALDGAPPVISAYLPISGRSALQMLDWPELALDPGRALLFTAKERRSVFRHPGPQTFRFFSVALSPELFATLLDEPAPPGLAALLTANGKTTLVHEKTISPATRALVAELGGPGEGGPLQRLHREAVAIRLLTEMIGAAADAPAAPATPPEDVAVRAAFEALVVDLRAPPTAAELARTAGMGLRRFLRAFEDMHGASPAQVLRQARLAEARRLIEEAGDLPLKTIAWRVGYAHVSNFVAAFAEQYGAPPRRFARKRSLAAE